LVVLCIIVASGRLRKGSHPWNIYTILIAVGLKIVKKSIYSYRELKFPNRAGNWQFFLAISENNNYPTTMGNSLHSIHISYHSKKTLLYNIKHALYNLSI